MEKMLIEKSQIIEVIINSMIFQNPVNRFSISNLLQKMSLVALKGINFQIDGLGVQSILIAALDLRIQYDYLEKQKYPEVYQLLETYATYINDKIFIENLLDKITLHFKNGNQNLYWQMIFDSFIIKIR